MTAFNFAYIPDPGKKTIQLGYASSLDATVRRALQKSAQPLMTVVAIADANAYLSQKHKKEIVLNGEAAALTTYEHNSAQWYRRSDLDALVIAENDSIPLKGEHDETAISRGPRLSFEQQQTVIGYIPLVERIAYGVAKKLPSSIDVGDLIGAGYLGLIDAVIRYDSTKAGSKPYIIMRIRGAIIDSLREKDPMQRSDRDNIKKVDLTARELQLSLGRTPTKQEIANALSVPIEKIHAIREKNVIQLSLDTPTDDDTQTLADTLASPAQTAEEILIKRSGGRKYRQAIEALPERLRKIYLLVEKGKTYAAIGASLGVTESRIAQLLTSAKEKIKQYVSGEKPQQYLLDEEVNVKPEPDRPKMDHVNEVTIDLLLQLPEANSLPEERIVNVLPLDRTETPVSSAALVYHGLAKYAGIRKGVPEDIAKVEEAMQYMTELQRGIIELYYWKNCVARRIEEIFGITHSKYFKERKAAEAIVKAVIGGTYKPTAPLNNIDSLLGLPEAGTVPEGMTPYLLPEIPEGAVLQLEGTEAVNKERKQKDNLPEFLYDIFAKRHAEEIPRSEKEGKERMQRAVDALSLTERVVIEGAYLEGKGVKEMEITLEITSDEYRITRKDAEEILLETLISGKIPAREATRDLSMRRTRDPEYQPTQMEAFLGDHYYHLLSEPCDSHIQEVFDTLTPQERNALASYYQQHVPIVRIAMELDIHYSAVRPLLEGALEKIRSALGERGIEYVRKDEVKKPAAAIKGIPRRKQDLYARMEAYRASHGKKGGEISSKEDELDLERYIGNLGKKADEIAEDTTHVFSNISLEERCQKKHKKVQAFLRQMRRVQNLSLEEDIHDLTKIIIGESTIDFLINSAAYPVAVRYAELLYARAKTHLELDSKDRQAQAYYVWPLATEATYNPLAKKDNIPLADHSNHFIQTYEAYADGEKTPEALVALYKENLALLRGYIAVVGWHIGSYNMYKPDWNYRPHWKIAWEELAGFLKKERKAPLHLRATSFRELVKDPAIKAALHRGYATMHHYSERARNIVVEQFTGFVRNRAEKLLYLGMSFDDAVQEGKNGLFRATSRFDYTLLTREGKPHKFITYARWWVDQMIKRAFQDYGGVPVHIQEQVSKMNKIEAELMQELGTKPSEAVIEEEFVARTGVSKATLKLIQKARLNMNPISLELTATDDPESRTLLDTLPDRSVVAADETTIDRQQAETIKDLLETVPTRQREVLRHRFWGNEGEGETLEEIGEKIDGVSRERIRQIERDALIELREKLKTKPKLRKLRKELGIDIVRPENNAFGEEEQEIPDDDSSVVARDMIFEAAIPNPYQGTLYSADDPAIAIRQRFIPESRNIIERYYIEGQSLVQIRDETRQPLEWIIGLLERFGKLLPKHDSH